MMKTRGFDYGIPDRMARAIDAMCRRTGKPLDERRAGVLDAVLTEPSRVSLTATEADILSAASAAAKYCYSQVERLGVGAAIIADIEAHCARLGVAVPLGVSEHERIARAVDSAWWARALRKEHARRLEHTAIQLGLTGERVDPYISRDSAFRQAKRNAKNAKLLESISMVNDRGQEYTLAALADLGTGNKDIRLDELMTRMRGFEEIAQDLGHVGMFITATCPSRFHAVGGDNPRYDGASARDGQAHLVKMFSRLRPALTRAGIPVYGFRIAEPHTDGCPHWHFVLFMPQFIEGGADRLAFPRAAALIRRYALGQGERRAPTRAGILESLRNGYPLTHKGRQDHALIIAHQWRVQERARQNTSEPGRKAQAVKVVSIDPKLGSACAYVIKYIAKNVNGRGVGDHKDRDGMTVAPDLFSGATLTASQRVTYWAQTHGIRQFQQVGGAPVGTWRELRRVQEETVRHASDRIKQAWTAVQSVKADVMKADGTTKTETVKQADWKSYLLAQGGPRVGRGAAIKVARMETPIDGKYAAYNAFKPVGVMEVDRPGVVYESVRYTWTVKGAGPARTGAAFDFPWTGVNNCTGEGKKPGYVPPAYTPGLGEKQAARLAAYLEKNPIENYPHGPEGDWDAVAEWDAFIEEQTRDFIDELDRARPSVETDEARAMREKFKYQAAKWNH
jgi:hypothetical protein